jgi:flagellar biosynthesis/type III secretory pathway protein FliH
MNHSPPWLPPPHFKTHGCPVQDVGSHYLITLTRHAMYAQRKGAAPTASSADYTDQEKAVIRLCEEVLRARDNEGMVFKDDALRAAREANTKLNRRLQALESNEGMQHAFRSGYEAGQERAAWRKAQADAQVELRFARYKASVRATLARLLRSAFTRTAHEEALRQFDLENPI